VVGLSPLADSVPARRGYSLCHLSLASSLSPKALEGGCKVYVASEILKGTALARNGLVHESGGETVRKGCVG
jgi:hypothetical protein